MSKLVPLLQDLLKDSLAESATGSIDTPVQGVHLFWASEPVARTPLLYSAGIVIVAQGHKLGYLGQRVFRYDRETYLVLGVPIPFECETHASPEEPLLGVKIDVDIKLLHGLVGRLAGRLRTPGDEVASRSLAGVEPVQMDQPLLDAGARLLRCLSDPLDAKVLGGAAVDEIVYRVLRGRRGNVLYNLTQHQTLYAAVARSLDRIHAEYHESLSIDDLARECGMSVSSFHRAFKRVTGESPLQYIKKIRLDKAKSLLVHDQMRVNNVAYEVGYESASQFSREFKRHFKVPPSEAHAIAYS